MFTEIIKMVKFVISFLFSFKSFPENSVQFYSDLQSKSRRGKECPKEGLPLRFKAHPERKHICNITYILPGPKEPTEKKISVACWPTMLKLYSKREDYFLGTETSGGRTWAAFTVKQTMDNIKHNHLKTMFAKSIEFYFNEDLKSVQRYRNEPYGAYFIPNIPSGNHFGPIFHFRDISRIVSKTVQKKREDLTSSSSRRFDLSAKAKPPEAEICRTVAAVHLHKILKAMKSNEEFTTTKHQGNCSLFLPVSHLFYDKSVWVLRNEKPVSKNIQDIFVFVTVYSFLDEEARQMFNPFSIYIQSLQYLPLKELHTEGINKVFVEYELDPVIPCTRTKLQLLKQNSVIRLKDIKVFLTEKFCPLTIMSTFQSKKLYIKVIGIKDTLPPPQYEIFPEPYGTNIKDDRLSYAIKTPVAYEFHKSRATMKSKSVSSRTVSKTKSLFQKVGKNKPKRRDDQLVIYQNKDFHVIIGTARVDLSPLIFGNSSVIAYEELSALPVLINNPEKADIKNFCITLAHEDYSKYEMGVLSNRSLYKNNTMIKLTVKCGYLLTPQCVRAHPSINKAYSRVITTLVDKEFAMDVLKAVFRKNVEPMNMEDYTFPCIPFRRMHKVDPPSPFKSVLNHHENSSFLFDGDSKKDVTGEITPPTSYFSGFCIDCVNQILMYLEGPTVSTFPTLLTELIKFNTNQGRILYSSDLIYENRIYEDFQHFGGMYCITMKSTVDDFLWKGSSLCYGVSVPEPAWKALKMISKLMSTKNVLEAVQENYLPRPEQIMSFDIEFGLPHCVVK